MPVAARRDVETIMANFGFESTTDDVLAGQDLSGKIALVNGSTSGIESPTKPKMAM